MSLGCVAPRATTHHLHHMWYIPRGVLIFACCGSPSALHSNSCKIPSIYTLYTVTYERPPPHIMKSPGTPTQRRRRRAGHTASPTARAARPDAADAADLPPLNIWTACHPSSRRNRWTASRRHRSTVQRRAVHYLIRKHPRLPIACRHVKYLCQVYNPLTNVMQACIL